MKRVKRWYDGEMHDCIRLDHSGGQPYYVDFDPERNMYRISVFDELGHWQDEFWFNAYDHEDTERVVRCKDCGGATPAAASQDGLSL